MNAYANARFVGMLLALGAAPLANAMELGQGATPSSSSPVASFTMPMFLDGARLPDMQEAWRAHFKSLESAAASAGTAPPEPEAATIDEAHQMLTRAEQVSRDAADVRDRAEALSRRFAADGSDGTASPLPEPMPAPVASPDGVVTETAGVSVEEAPNQEAQAQVQKASASAGSLAAGDNIAPASMLGGPAADQSPAANAAPTADGAPAADAAPVIEDMAKKPQPRAKISSPTPPARRVVVQTARESPGFFASIFSGSGSSEAEATSTDAPDKILPREIRSFGWNSQP